MCHYDQLRNIWSTKMLATVDRPIYMVPSSNQPGSTACTIGLGGSSCAKSKSLPGSRRGSSPKENNVSNALRNILSLGGVGSLPEGADGASELDDNPSVSLQCRDSLLSSVLSDISSNELQDLVEDKEIAARAVAFVVNSSRKGVVPLCADVATLLRAKRKLEHRIARLRNENECLRSSRSTSIRTSQSTSPPPSLHSSYDRGSLPDHTSHLQVGITPPGYFPKERSRPCSRCSSHCSSLVSNSPKLDKLSSHQRSPRLHRTSAFTTGSAHKHITMALVHSPQSDITAGDVAMASSPQESASSRLKPHERKNSLPEIVSEPHGSVPKINPRATAVSKETQCVIENSEESTDGRLEEQFKDTVRLNSQLAEELGAAKKEIEILKGRLKELEMTQLARHWLDQFHVEDERSPRKSPASLCVCSHCQPGIDGKEGGICLHSSPRPSPILQHIRKASPVMIPAPLFGCMCRVCQLETNKLAPPGGELNMKNGITCDRDWSRTLQIEIEDHVVVKGERTGHVRYIGHLDNLGPPDTVFVGLELDAPVGRHNGALEGKQYFSCLEEHGLFLPIQEVMCIMRKKKKVPTATLR